MDTTTIKAIADVMARIDDPTGEAFPARVRTRVRLAGADFRHAAAALRDLAEPAGTRRAIGDPLVLPEWTPDFFLTLGGALVQAEYLATLGDRRGAAAELGKAVRLMDATRRTPDALMLVGRALDERAEDLPTWCAPAIRARFSFEQAAANLDRVDELVEMAGASR